MEPLGRFTQTSSGSGSSPQFLGPVQAVLFRRFHGSSNFFSSGFTVPRFGPVRNLSQMVPVPGRFQAVRFRVNNFINSLASHFSLKDIGQLSYFLGVEVIPHTQGLFLCQSKYIHDILKCAKMLESKLASTPMSSNTPLLLNHGTPFPNPTSYRAIVGALQYLSLNRPDFAFTVNKLSQFMHAPTDLY